MKRIFQALKRIKDYVAGLFRRKSAEHPANVTFHSRKFDRFGFKITTPFETTRIFFRATVLDSSELDECKRSIEEDILKSVRECIQWTERKARKAEKYCLLASLGNNAKSVEDAMVIEAEISIQAVKD